VCYNCNVSDVCHLFSYYSGLAPGLANPLQRLPSEIRLQKYEKKGNCQTKNSNKVQKRYKGVASYTSFFVPLQLGNHVESRGFFVEKGFKQYLAK
jgi:hypothetical protein